MMEQFERVHDIAPEQGREDLPRINALDLPEIRVKEIVEALKKVTTPLGPIIFVDPNKPLHSQLSRTRQFWSNDEVLEVTLGPGMIKGTKLEAGEIFVYLQNGITYNVILRPTQDGLKCDQVKTGPME